MRGADLVTLYKAQFKTPPYKHQAEDAEKLIDHAQFGLLNEMGVGKSKAVVDAACILAEEGMIDAVLVLAPASVRSVWIEPTFGEIKKHCWLKTQVVEFHNPTKVIWQDEGAPIHDGVRCYPILWVVTNYEFIRRPENEEKLVNLLHGTNFMIVADESSFIKSRKAAQTKAATRLARLATRRVILNGTPISNNPLDLWSQAEFLGQRILPYKNFYHFRSEFAVMGGFHNHQVIQWKNLDKLQRELAPHVVRREKKDCLDLPEKIYTQAEVPLDEKTWEMYKEMRDEAIVWMDKNPSLAAQAGVKVMRLSQITSGFLGGFVDEEVESEKVDEPPREVGREKLDFFRSWIEERLNERPTTKFICWSRWRAEIERTATSLKDLLRTYKLYGGQTAGERHEAVDRFSNLSLTGEGALLVAQQQAGGFGLNLVAVDSVAYISNSYSLMQRLQSEDRCHRPGQKRNVLYLDISAVGPKNQKTVDHAILKAIRTKNDLAQWTVNAWKQILMEE